LVYNYTADLQQQMRSEKKQKKSWGLLEHRSPRLKTKKPGGAAGQLSAIKRNKIWVLLPPVFAEQN
jgi:hypothetical protein|tara:strand:+ start:165 stop:362 length:198 start_codon:yes stop_codon:yes gene_type:complete